MPELTLILNRSTNNSSLMYSEFEKVLVELADIGFKSSPPGERFASLLKKFSKRTRTLSGADIDIKSAYGLARQFQLSGKMKDSMSQRNILKKSMIRGKMSESLVKINGSNGTSMENILKTLKNEDQAFYLVGCTGKHSRVNSMEVRGEMAGGRNEAEEKLRVAGKIVAKLGKGVCKGGGTEWATRNVGFLQRKRKSMFSAAFFMRMIVRAWSMYVKGKKGKALKSLRRK